MHATAELAVKDADVNAIEPLSEDSVRESVQLLKLLADETRLRILYLLHQAHELNVLELCKLLRQRQPSVSHHLALLRSAGLIDMRRDGKHNYYRIVLKRFEQIIASVYNVTPGGIHRICLEDYELRYCRIPVQDGQA